MNFLKGLLVSVLSLILFAAISTLAFAFMLNQTVMDPNFTAAEIDKVDIASLASSFYQVPNSAPNSAALNSAITASIKAAEPELKTELRAALYSTYDYFFSRNVNLNLNISLEPVKNNLKTTLRASLPPMSDAEFNQYFDQFTQNIPSSFTFDSSTSDASTIETLQEVRQSIAYYQYWWLTIPLILVLAAAIILLENNLRSSLRDLGINLFIFGAIGIASDYLLNRYATPSTVIPGLPAALSNWLNGFINDVLAPLNTFSIAVAVIGAVLIIVSFIVPKKEAAGAKN